jgi:hypothetical protein
MYIQQIGMNSECVKIRFYTKYESFILTTGGVSDKNLSIFSKLIRKAVEKTDLPARKPALVAGLFNST